MEYINLILIIIVITSLLLIFILLIYNHFQTYIIKINIAENKIDKTLSSKFDTLAKGINFISDQKIITQIKQKLESLKDKKTSNLNLNYELTIINNTYLALKEEQTNNYHSFKSLLNELREINEQLDAYKGYYHQNIIKYNKMIRMFPTNIVSMIARFKEKPSYDNIDIPDEK